MAYGRIAAHVALLGIGTGCYITLLNAAVIDRYGAGAARRLAFVHASATAGAGSGPWLIGWAQAVLGGGWPGTFRVLGALYAALALLGLMWRFPEPHASSATQAEQAASSRSERLRSPELYLLALVIFAYVGVENGLTLLAVPWAVSRGVGESVGRAAISAFWLALMAGRLALVFRQRVPTASLLVACGIAGAFAIGVAALTSSSPVIALAAAGLALGPVYPATIALTGRTFPRGSGAALGLVSGAGACGGFALPWLSGIVGDAFAVTASISLLAGGAVVLAIAAFVLPAPQDAPG
jgi:fucose permease